MAKLFYTFAICFFAISVFAQTNISQPMNFRIEKEVVPPLLKVVPRSQTFIDEDKNGVIDANEVCSIYFVIENEGRGDGYGCVAKITTDGTMDGITMTKEIALPVIPHGTKQPIEIPIKAGAGTKTGEIRFSIVVEEPHGYGTDPIVGTIGTHKLRTPFVQVASYKPIGAKGGVLKRREIFKLQVLVQNTDQGTAENVTVGLQLPDNVNWLGGTEEHLNIGTLKPNEAKSLEYELMANQRAADNISIHIAVAERTGKFAKSADIPLQMGQYMGGTITMDVERKDDDVHIVKASLVSDVDENIPETKAKNPNMFALIIANEHYMNPEIDPVPFALNDGNIFREYCLKTLGISEKHIRYVADAVSGQIKEKINWLANITDTWDDPQIIVYYAGHGIPDEKSKTAYLLPVDGSAKDVTTGFKLDDLYAILGKMPASRITVFLDACFSGAKREGDMIVKGGRAVALAVTPNEPVGNMVVFSATKDDETAHPFRTQQHGLFTYYLLKKLQQTKGDVTLQELGEYIYTEVRRGAMEENGKPQNPTITPSAEVGTEWQNWKLK